MDGDQIITEENLSCARQLVERMEAGDEDAARELLDQLAHQRESTLYMELGKLTRQFHDALNSFRMDSRLASIAEEEIPDARERLNYVVKMTDQAANRTLTAVEASLPLCDTLEQQSESLNADWQRFTGREMEIDEFRTLSRRVTSFLAEGGTQLSKVRANLNDVLMAQDFQDLTGQIIKRVVTLVGELEASLVNLIRISGQKFVAEGDASPRPKAGTVKDIEPEGPPVPGVSDAGVVSGQDEVDDLLSSLGF